MYALISTSCFCAALRIVRWDLQTGARVDDCVSLNRPHSYHAMELRISDQREVRIDTLLIVATRALRPLASCGKRLERDVHFSVYATSLTFSNELQGSLLPLNLAYQAEKSTRFSYDRWSFTEGKGLTLCLLMSFVMGGEPPPGSES